jgi:DNA repair exonuclease SbcCD ATPase subunit
MKSLDIKYLYAQNFLCFGPDAFELDLADCGNIVLVKGFNMDVSDESKTASNGSGKSSIPEILVYTLFGKTIKHPKKINHKDVVNNQTGKDLKTEVRWGDFRVVRTRKPETLRMWESKEGIWNDATEITLGGMPATQKLIEEKLGLNYETFVNVVVFTDNNAGSFLECDAANKRDIVENLLSLEKYKNFSERAKNLKKDKKDEIKTAQHEYESARQGLQQAQSRMKAAKEQESVWRDKRKGELETLSDRLKSLEKQLSSSPEGEDSTRYDKAQERIVELNSLIEQLEARQIKIQGMLDEANDKSSTARDKRADIQTELNEACSSIKSISIKISEHQKEIGRLEDSDGATCKFCMGTISKENFGKYTEKMSEEIKKLSSELESKESKKESLSSSVESAKARENSIVEAALAAKGKLSKVSSELSSMRKELSDLNKIEKPKSKNISQQLVEQQIAGVKEQISDKKKEMAGDSPFVKIIDSLDKEILEKESCFKRSESSLESLEKELPYYEFWSTAFGDAGIRKFVIDGIIPALNSRIAYWMQFLIDGKIKLEFNNELEETIERNPSDGDPFVYYGMSGGEKRRLNLAVSQAFAHVMMLSSGACPSIVFLDEVTTNIDQMGVVGVYNMIAELAKDRQVFVTTHDQNLLELLDGCELIALEKRNGFTRLKKQK